jgi:KipI family sensor histidine kinase inhibitor
MLYFKDAISPETLNQVQHTFHLIRKIEGIVDITPSYTSLLIEYDTALHSHLSLEKVIKTMLKETSSNIATQHKHIKIPTDYSKGEDLASVAKYHGLNIEEIIHLHSSTLYRVYAIGFMVGFAYLGTLPTKLFTPRHSTPRAKVPKGAVAIADNQTAVYPQQSPGGWNIIGHTDFDDFASFSIGDSVEFIRI